MKKFVRSVSALAVAAASMLVAPTAFAAWSFTTNAGVAAGDYSGTGTTSAGAQMGIQASGWSSVPPNAFTDQSLVIYSGAGFGMQGTGDAQHGLDNITNKEAVLLKFDSSVVLSSVKLGYISGDSDITVLRWNGNAAGPNMASMTPGNLISSGWDLVGSYADLALNTSKSTSNTTKGSSWWLISAFNSTYGGASSTTLTDNDDYFKLAAVSGKACVASTTVNCGSSGNGGNAGVVPEPASLALVALALVGICGSRSRRKDRAATLS